jgi:Predicted signal transduction protein with a C-terminal ATPase domain
MVIGYLSFSKSKALLREKTSKYTMDILSEISKNMELKLHAVEQVSKIIFVNKDVQKLLNNANKGFENEFLQVDATREIRKFLSKTIETNDDIDSVYMISNTGIVFSVILSTNTFKLTDHIAKQADPGEGKSVWCSTDVQTRTIPLVRVVNDMEKFKKIGYLVINIKENSLSDIYSKTTLKKNGELYIINNDGSIVSHESKAMLGQKQNTGYLDKILSGSSQNEFFTTEIDKRNYYIAFHPISGTTFKIISIVPAIEYEKEIITLRNAIMVIAFICWFFAVIISFYMSSSISRPIHKLYTMMNKVGKGDFNVTSTYESKDEIGVLNLHFNNMVRQINKLIQDVYQEQLLKQKEEMKSLKMQINPHFLYNTLESINWLARANGATDVSKMVKALGDLMRTSIGGEDFISLEEEIKNIRNYIVIQKYRYGERLTVDFNIDSLVLHVRVPKLIIQPLVENSIVHGIEKRHENGVILIESHIEEDNVIISVTDNGNGIKSDELESILNEEIGRNQTKIGLINIHRRIRLYYGEEYGVTIQSKFHEGTKASIHIPFTQNSTAAD